MSFEEISCREKSAEASNHGTEFEWVGVDTISRVRLAEGSHPLRGAVYYIEI